MTLRRFVPILALLFLATGASAQDKTKFAKSGRSYATVVSASMQRRIPGMKGADPIISYSFIIKWKSKQVPETFFWRGNNTWMNCGVKVYKPAKKNAKGEEIGLEHIKSGSCIELIPVPGGRFPMPDEIQNTKGQAIFFKTASSGWRYLPVTKITKKKDLLMP